MTYPVIERLYGDCVVTTRRKKEVDSIFIGKGRDLCNNFGLRQVRVHVYLIRRSTQNFTLTLLHTTVTRYDSY